MVKPAPSLQQILDSPRFCNELASLDIEDMHILGDLRQMDPIHLPDIATITRKTRVDLDEAPHWAVTNWVVGAFDAGEITTSTELEIKKWRYFDMDFLRLLGLVHFIHKIKALDIRGGVDLGMIFEALSVPELVSGSEERPYPDLIAFSIELSN
ncbi:hypothetical protein FRB97_001613 [Tulasnella sp. 331]|nr:hypothetical protein FRB97_001613 [Tulasnella sp. 331]